MKKTFLALMAVAGVAAAAAMLSACTSKAKAGDAQADAAAAADSLPTVYYVSDITPDNLLRIYHALGRKAVGNNVAVKISTGESGKSNQLDPALIAPLINEVKGTIVECNTAYGGSRSTTADHLRAAAEHGYTAIAKVDIMDCDGDTALAVDGGLRLDKNLVGKHLMNYDFLVVLSHFKGHQMGGFGGALKNVAIGIASSRGKAYIHSAGKVDDPAVLWDNLPEQDAFLESMADACKSVFDLFGDRVLFINVANRLSVDCDCDGNPAAPEMADLGIFASLDPVALDRACVDMVVNSDDPGKAALIERINSRHGTHTIDAAAQLGLGSQAYTLVALK